MAALRSRKHLRCFYCGRKSNVQFEAQESFDCTVCSATNWLDQNGEITDPPAGTERTGRDVRYGFPRSSMTRSPSPVGFVAGSSTSDPIFCATCLRNQHMLSSSIAQFEWPDEPVGPEYRARERQYWALRKELEKRYPQVCQDCLPMVNRKLREASYTAQTDHLRRVMDRTRSRQTEVKRRGWLDVVDFIGKSSWYAGFALQAAWHLTVVLCLVTELYSSPTDDDDIIDDNRITVVLGALYRTCNAVLPQPDRLMQWAINLGMCSFPWNPRFKQSIRGFTAHILGFRQWYTYQFLALLVRFVALSLAQFSKSKGVPADSQLAAQLALPLFVFYIYLTAKKSIHTDTTPLFQRPAELTAGSSNHPVETFSARNHDSFGDVLDDVLHAPLERQDRATSISPPSSPPLPPISSPRVTRSGKSFSSITPVSRVNRVAATSASSRPSDKIFSRATYESPISRTGDEMDWSPSASQHRAFGSYNPYRVKNMNPRFNDAPTEPKPGPLWYRVPPAPTNPSQRLRNPPMRPIIRESPKERETFFKPTERQPIDFSGRSAGNTTELNLMPAKFYAPEPKDDPRDGLSNMFANSFTISPDPEDLEERQKAESDAAEYPNTVPNRAMTRIVELIVLLITFCGWIFALGSEELYGRGIGLASICVCLIVSIRLAADLEVDRQIRGDNRRPPVLTPSFVKLALLQVFVAILLLWDIWSRRTSLASSGVYGNTLFGSIIIHHMWHILA